MSYKFILASGSPRRFDLLTAEGQNFIVKTADVDETVSSDLSPEEVVKSLALRKAQKVYSIYKKPTLGADTVVVFDNTVIGKPTTMEHAKRMLKGLSNNKHYVLTGIALIGDGYAVNEFVKTDVYMNELSDEFINDYVESKKAMDKAGAYGMQDGGFVEKIEGSYTNVVGLPMERTKELLKEYGLWQEIE
jgi:septum formation protein